MTHREMQEQFHTRSVVDHLVARCKWSAQRYEKAAEQAQDDELKSFLTRCAVQRKSFVGELLKFASSSVDLGEETEPIGRRLVLRGDLGDDQLARDCYEKESNLIQAYQDALLDPLPGDLQRLIAAQARTMMDAFDFLHSLIIRNGHRFLGTNELNTPTHAHQAKHD